MPQKRRRPRDNRPWAEKRAEREGLDRKMRTLSDLITLNVALEQQEFEVAADAAERLEARGELRIIPGGAKLPQQLREAQRRSGRTTDEFLKGLGAWA